MNRIDFEIYKSIQKEKTLTEIYLGNISFPWTYAINEYAADYTEAIAFTPFDKVICGLLAIDNILSLEEIATILGLNIIDNPANNQYRDIAEHEVLVESLTSLFDFGMIEKGDSYFSRCCLTEIGREYTVSGKKFKTTENKEFKLYFDITTCNHQKAKEVFQDLKPESKIQAIDLDYFYDENYLKNFAENQIPEIYSPEYGKSFTNSMLKRITFYTINMFAGILYDFQLNTYRIKLYNQQVKSDYFTNNANDSKELKTEIIESFFESLQPVNSIKCEQQQEFEEKTCKIQSDADYLFYLNNPLEAVEKVNLFYKETDIIEIPNFWLNPEIWLDNQIGEIFIYFRELQEFQIILISRLANNQPKNRFYIAFDFTSFDVSKLPINVFWCKNIQIKQFCCFSIKWHISHFAFLVPFNNNSFNINLIIRNSNDYSEEVNTWKKHFASKYIPILLQEFQSFLNSDIKSTLNDIEIVQNADKKVLCFENWFSYYGFETHFTDLKQQKNELLKQLKQKHKAELSEKLDVIISTNSIENFENLNQINQINAIISAIESDCISEYTELLEKIEKLKAEIIDKEFYIKDQLLAKHYIIDTNVFVDYPEILSKIDIKHYVVLSARVIDELDRLKRKLKSENKANVEKALRLINHKLSKKKNIKTAKADLKLLPEDLDGKSPDNQILCVALMYKDKNPFLLTSDNGLQAKARIFQIPTISLSEFLQISHNNFNIKTDEIRIQITLAPSPIHFFKDYMSEYSLNHKVIFVKNTADGIIYRNCIISNKELDEETVEKMEEKIGLRLNPKFPVSYDYDFNKYEVFFNKENEQVNYNMIEIYKSFVNYCEKKNYKYEVSNMIVFITFSKLINVENTIYDILKDNPNLIFTKTKIV
jgi:rRNA-processing protein FCF1